MAKQKTKKNGKAAAGHKAAARNGGHEAAGQRAERRAWTKEDLRDLKMHSKGKTPVIDISKEMQRTVGALRQQALKLGISLGHRR
jgi:hypothetical protein